MTFITSETDIVYIPSNISCILQYICYNHSNDPNFKTRPGRMEDIEYENRLKLARIEVGLTQEQLAEQVGVTRQTIGLIEAGKYNPTLKLCLMLAKITGKNLNELFWIKGSS